MSTGLLNCSSTLNMNRLAGTHMQIVLFFFLQWILYFIFFYSSLVIDTLQDVDPSRKCYRLVEGILVERTVKEVLPALENNKEEVTTDNRIYSVFECSVTFSMEWKSKFMYTCNICICLGFSN